MEKNRSLRQLFALMATVLFVLLFCLGKGFAAESQSGQLTDTISYSFNGSTGELKITGTGAMPDYDFIYDVPWYSYQDAIKKVTIGNGITVIGENCFSQCGMTSVKMANSVVELHEDAFENSIYLEKVELSSNLKIIGSECFFYCYALKDINLPDGLEIIEDNAFYDCELPVGFYIPSSVKEIGIGAFGANPFYDALWEKGGCIILGDGILFEYNGKETEVVIPDGVKKINTNSFRGNEYIQKVVIPNSVEVIESYAFYECIKLKDVNIPKTVKEIGWNSFESTIFIDSQTDEYVIFGDGILYAYNGQGGNISIPSGVKTINPYVFEDNKKIKNVIIPNTVTLIGYGAFSGCMNTKCYVIPSSVKLIQARGVGYYTTGSMIGKMSYGDFIILGEEGSYAQQYAETEKFHFVKDEDLQDVCGDDASYRIDIETGTLIISGTGNMYSYSYDSAFWQSYSECIENIVVEEGITSIGSYAFYYMENVKSISLPDTLEKIESNAFYGMSGIKEISIPSKISEIKNTTFSNMSHLSKIEISSDNGFFTVVDNVVFSKDLKTLVYYPSGLTATIYWVPDGTEVIETGAFNSAYTDIIVFPSSVNTMKKNVFYMRYDDTLIFEGKAPANIVNSFAWSNYIEKLYYDSSKGGWFEVIGSINNYDGDMVKVDLNEYEKKISDSEKSLTVGQSYELKIYGGAYNAFYTWYSDNPMVAGVTKEGVVYALLPGTANIIAKGKNGFEDCSCKITVTGTVATLSDGVYELNDVVPEYYDDRFRIIPCDNLGGFYIFDSGKLYFYNIASHVKFCAYDFGSALGVYADSGKLYVANSDNAYVYDLNQQKMIQILGISAENATAIGADANGNIYIAYGNGDDHKEMKVFTSAGIQIANSVLTNTVLSFAGFDSTNGNFYMECFKYYEMYFHMGVNTIVGAAGRFKDGKLTVVTNYLTADDVYFDWNASLEGRGNLILTNSSQGHVESLKLLENKYLVSACSFFNKVWISDSNAYQFNAERLIGNLYSYDRSGVDGDSTDARYCSVGVNAVYNNARKSLIVYKNNCELEEIDVMTGTVLANIKSQYSVFNMYKEGEKLFFIEKQDNKYYLEIKTWKLPTSISISGADKLDIGASIVLHTVTDTGYEGIIDWTSSDNSIASVTDDGKVVGWSAGTVTITAKIKNTDLIASKKITVNNNTTLKNGKGAFQVSGKVTNNIDQNYYDMYAQPVYSYLYVDEDGNMVRVEYSQKIIVEIYDANYNLKTSKSIAMELPLFGGFFHSENGYNYVVVGNENADESDANEVIRIIKYDASWKKVGAKKICGENTHTPFDAGSCRMTELNGKLYIHTCHTMYTSDDGYNHQANMSFVIDENTLNVDDSYSEVMNISNGYVSHSFNQYILTDGDYIYRIDHGDANPRGIAVTWLPVGNKLGDVTAYWTVFGFKTYDYWNYNYTGAAIGDAVLSSNNIMISGVSDNMTETEDNYPPYNAFVIVVQKDGMGRKVVWLTNNNSGKIAPSVPYLVKLNEDQFLAMWTEQDRTDEVNYKYVTKLQLLDGSGNLVGPTVTTDFRLSDCKPIVTDGKVVQWYVTDGSKMTWYSVQPYKLASYAPAMSLNSASNASTSIILTWSKVNNVSGYVVYRKSGSGSYVKLADVAADKVSYEDKTALPGVEYTYAMTYKIGKTEVSKKSNSKSATRVYDLTVMITPGETIDLYDQIIPAGNDGISLTYAIAGTSRVGMTGNKLFGKKVGTASITVKNNSVKAATVHVKVEFVDVRKADNPYYYNPVYWAVDKGITNGFKDEDGYSRRFGPAEECTRAQMVTFLWRLAGKPEVKSAGLSFSDVKEEDYYYMAVLWAASKGITKGYEDGTFRPDDPCLREHAATFLWRYAGKPKTSAANTFSDVSSDDYFYKPVLWAASKGIAKGYEDGTYRPGDTCLREHIVTFMYRYNKNV